MQGVVPEHDHDLYLGTQLDHVYNTPFWYNFVVEAERRLRVLGISSRGVADGDLALPGCVYASLRNEAYIKVPDIILQDLGGRLRAGIDAKEEGSSDTFLGSDVPKDHEPPPSYAMVLKYPPNDSGWNAARHPNPLLELIFFLRVTEPLHSRIAELEMIASSLQDRLTG